MTITSNAVVIFALSTWLVMFVWQMVSGHLERKRARRLLEEMMGGEDGEDGG